MNVAHVRFASLPVGAEGSSEGRDELRETVAGPGGKCRVRMHLSEFIASYDPQDGKQVVGHDMHDSQ